jgi:hypothetical protein
MKKDIYATLHTKEHGKLEPTKDEWGNLDLNSITFHRIDGPAIEYANGTKQWWINNELHRIDGPAVEQADGSKEWYVNDNQLYLLPKKVLIHYMKANNLTLTHLLTDPDPLIRKSASKYKWRDL